MKNLFITLSIGAVLASCSSSTETSGEVKTDSTAVVAQAQVTKIEEGKVYPFMELKELYNINWKGEEAGNADLDGKTVTVTGEVFSVGKVSKLLTGNDMEVTGAKMEFRGSEFKDPDFGHDFECRFPAEIAQEIADIKKGTTVKVTGVIEKQELYIESADFKYTVMTIKDCKIVK
jgi:hypothetical protein